MKKRTDSARSIIKDKLMFIMKLLLFFAALAIGIILWATYHNESFATCTYPIALHIFTLPIFWSPEFIIDTIRIDIILHHGVLIGIELVILSFIIFKLFFRMQIRAILRLRSIAAIAFSSFILYFVIFEILHLDRTEIWGRFVAWIAAYGSLITYTSLFRFNADLYTKFLLIAAIFLVSYIFTTYQVRSHRRSILSSGTITVLSDDLIERSSIRDLVRKAKLRSGIFQKKITFAVSLSLGHNAYSTVDIIVIGAELFEEEEICLGIIAHELGHFANKDSEVSLVVQTAVNALLLPLNLVAFACNIVSILPFGFLVSLLGSLAMIIFGLISKIYLFIDDHILYFFGGRRAEKRADIFAVDIGYGEGLYRSLLPYTRYKTTLRNLLDVHPSEKARCRYIRKRMEENAR